MASRAQLHRKSKRAGSMRMDAAVEAMDQLGFGKQLVQQTVKELLDVYGTSGWPYIEEASYKLLIEAILDKQQGSVEDKDGSRRNGAINETSSAGISEVGSSGLVAGDTLLHTNDDVSHSVMQVDRGGHEQGSNYSAFVKTPMIQSSEAFDHLPCHKGKGYYGWIGNGSDADVELINFPVPQLPKQIEKMIGQYEPPQSGR